jgi:hypothetical protein
MLAFYRHQRADDCPADTSGDMLLFEWGIWRWSGPEHFCFSLTRQFILGGISEDENIWQVSLSFKFAPADALRALGADGKWCEKTRPRASIISSNSSANRRLIVPSSN